MEKVTEYKVVLESYSKELTESVQKLIVEGWQPLGPAQIALDDREQSLALLQTLVRYAN